MIEGLRIDIKTEELRQHITERAKHHRDKAEWYASRISDLRTGDVGANEGASNDPTSSLKGSLKTHQTQCAFFTFLADHLIPDETYRLVDNDLARLEILSRYF